MRTSATPRSIEGMTLMEINAGDTAWVLVSAALVLLMTPGLAFFYGGMVRVKSTLNMMMMSAITIAVVTVLWVVVGYSLTFGGDTGRVIGDFSTVGLKGLLAEDAVSGTIPTLAFVAFQLMFAIITPALISGAIADRATFRGWIVFVALWTTLVYFPVAHSVWFLDGDNPGGFIGTGIKAIDFAGGTAVHVNAGAAALALAIVLGKRIGWRKDPMRPHSLPLVVLGAGLLWFGWFGFNAGSALSAGATAAITFVNTQAATAAAVIGWLIVERIRHGKATTLGMASGAVAGLVAITPACGAVTPLGALILGLVAGGICAFAVSLKYKLGFDDSLDVVGVHLVGGLVGSLGIGFLGTAAAPSAVDGLFYGGGVDQLGRQALANLIVGVYSFVVAFILAKLIDLTIGFRVKEDDEVIGVDQVEHAETAYDFLGASGLRGHGPAIRTTAPAEVEEASSEEPTKKEGANA
ncbi:Amt family ammonium transporter [Kribbella sp. VKM Ac-2527]|uniref:Ammonium transporter n=2 Tax=Kribbella caucasensis TaxID=2512215 RepID=A0A4R6KS49_9ACTN|nr:ammonium transporter [Kribbella sp. VKM Ac-2527]TDO52769.1 Amt family ammonium transporter [Kribbella sp. VKM Ac-2527]